jgi:glycosyltransferase involved in cell wall biosynthesis
MILFQDFVRAAQRVHAEMPDFLLIGQRWDLSVIEEMDFNNPQWRELLHLQIREHGMLHAECGLDYFIFSRHLYQAIPPFAIGRTAWDNWLVKDPYTRGVPVIDGTECITAVHQDHDYGHLDGGRREAWRGAEAKRNRSLLGPAGNMGRTSAAPWVLSKAGTLTKLGPREETFLTTAYRKARSIWLLREAKRLVDADRADLAACKCEEARELLDIWLTPRLSNKVPAQPADRARAVELYVLSFASLAQCYVQMGRPKQAVTMYTRILENPWLHLPEARRDRIARLRDRVASLAGVSAARRLSGPKEPPTTQTSTDDAPVELRPKVTVITTCYNAAPYLPDCLESILAQSFGDWELLLLDDGSTDGTRAIIKQYEARDRRIRSCFFDEKRGPYVRRNYAIGQARADFIVIHDADDLMDRDKLNALHVAISQDSRLGVVGSFYRMFLDGHPELDHTDDIILSKSHEEILQRYRAEGTCDFCPHGVAIIRKQLFELIGPYDENPFGADSLWIAKVLEYALQTGEVRVQNRPEFLTLRRMHLESQTGRLPSFDPRSPRPRYWQHVVGKLEHVIRNLNASSHVDVAAELRRVTGKRFFEANEHLFEQWRNAPVTREIEQHFVSVIRTRFNKGQFVLCVMACEVVERLAEGIARRTPLYDYCRGLAYFCLGLTTQSREYLEREIEAHGTGQARAFLGRYLERYDKNWTRGDRVAFVRQALSGDPREARGDDGAAFPKLEAPANDHDVEAALAALERRYRALPDETAGKQAVAVRLSELCRRVGLTEKSVELRDEAKALRRRRGGDAQCVSQITGGAAG